MVAVAADERLEIARHHLFEILPFGYARRAVPLVEAFVPHQETHFIAQIQQLLRAGVVRGADRVHAHVLHHLQLTAHRALVERHPQRAEIGMKVHALELHAPAVEMKTVVRGELRPADSVAVLPSADLHLVKLGIDDIPEDRVFNREFVDDHVRRYRGEILDAHERLFGGYFRCGYFNRSPHGAILRIFHRENDVAVDARPGIPAAVMAGGVDLDRKLVLFAESDF